MKKWITAGLIGGILFLVNPPLRGAGFLIYEQGAAAMALAGAFVSLAYDPTAIFYNPAGIARMEGTQISLGTTWITANSSVSLPLWPDPQYRSIRQERRWFYPSTFYFTHKLSDTIVAGFGFFSAYGLGTAWPPAYPLRHIAVSSTMNTFFFNPTLSIKLNDDLSLGAGISYIYSTLSLELVRPVGEYEVPLSLGTTGRSWGMNAGVLYRGEDFSFGFIWRGGFKVQHRGDVTLDASHLPPSLQVILPAQGIASTMLMFPHLFGIGVSSILGDNLTLAVDIHYALWSVYEKQTLSIDFSSPFPDEEHENSANWKNAFAVRGGIEFWTNKNLALRTGVLYDQTPQPRATMDPFLPDADRVALTGGLGLRKGSLAVDIAYQLEFFLKRKSPNRNVYLDTGAGINYGEGVYSTVAHLIGVSICYIF